MRGPSGRATLFIALPAPIYCNSLHFTILLSLSVTILHLKTRIMKQLFTFFISYLLLCLPARVHAAKHIIKYKLTEAQYQQTFDSLSGKGFIPIDMDITTLKGKPYFAIIWEEDVQQTAWQARHNLTETAYNETNTSLSKEGYTIQNLVPYYTEQKELRFAALWYKKEGQAFFARYNLTEDEYVAIMDEQHEKGIYPFRITVYEHEGVHKFAVVWGEIGKVVNGYRNFLEPEECKEAITWMFNNGYYIMDLAAYTKAGKTYYSGFWLKLPMISRTKPRLSLEELHKTIENYTTHNYTPYIITGFTENNVLYYGATWDPQR